MLNTVYQDKKTEAGVILQAKSSIEGRSVSQSDPRGKVKNKAE